MHIKWAKKATLIVAKSMFYWKRFWQWNPTTPETGTSTDSKITQLEETSLVKAYKIYITPIFISDSDMFLLIFRTKFWAFRHTETIFFSTSNLNALPGLFCFGLDFPSFYTRATWNLKINCHRGKKFSFITPLTFKWDTLFCSNAPPPWEPP